MSDTKPPALAGTRVWSTTRRESGEPLPPPPPNIPRVTYTFMPDGSGTMMPGTIAAVPMHWKVEAGRLRLTTAVPKSQSTHDFDMPDADTLVLMDCHGGQNVFKRSTGADG